MTVYPWGMTTALQIKEVAEASGFTAATLRYYEQIGLLPESTRTPAGYHRRASLAQGATSPIDLGTLGKVQQLMYYSRARRQRRSRSLEGRNV